MIYKIKFYFIFLFFFLKKHKERNLIINLEIREKKKLI
jgi:hypothetical protein